jgi:hypothetical protein
MRLFSFRKHIVEVLSEPLQESDMIDRIIHNGEVRAKDLKNDDMEMIEGEFGFFVRPKVKNERP